MWDDAALMRVSWAVRVLRAAVFAVACVTLAAAAHRLAMGGAPPLWADGWGFLGVLAVACPLCGRERSLAAIGGAMTVVQVTLHIAFNAALAHQAVMSMPGMGTPVRQGVHPLTAHAAAAHLLAALAASWWLRRGEAAFWSLLRRRAAMLVPALTAWWSAHRVLVPGMPCPAGRRLRLPPAARPLLRHALSRRGPPTRIPPRVLCA
jgi:multidrug transporter EmrE-like cation transporter